MTNSDKKSYPSEVEIKEFWEWCGGLEYSRLCGKTYELVMPDGGIVNCRVESVDLNSLFRYAVPKLDEHSAPATEYVMGVFCDAVYRHQDPALALFWAIWEVIK